MAHMVFCVRYKKELEGLDEPMTVTFHASAVEPAALRREEVLAA